MQGGRSGGGGDYLQTIGSTYIYSTISIDRYIYIIVYTCYMIILFNAGGGGGKSGKLMKQKKRPKINSVHITITNYIIQIKT